MAVMADSCVLLDVFSRDRRWYDWSASALANAVDVGTIVINPVIYSEISIRFETIEELDSLLDPSVFKYQLIPREAAFLAGKCFLKYRRRGGNKELPLPDFLIGAHAYIMDYSLITRDVRRFRDYYPRLKLIAP
jgi:predicted nucleic acid-binding protein